MFVIPCIGMGIVHPTDSIRRMAWFEILKKGEASFEMPGRDARSL